MKKKKTIKVASKPTYQGYSYGFKVAIVERVENGQMSINQAAKEYDVSRSGIQKWIKKYGNLDKKLRGMGGKSPQQTIDDLRKQLREAQQKVSIWESAMEIIEEDYGIDVKKKYLNSYQKRVLKRIKSNTKK